VDFQKNDLKEYGFSGFVTIFNLKANGCNGIPKEKGVYIVAKEDSEAVVYLEKSVGGHFKGKYPTVSISELSSNWVEGAYVLYVGQTGAGKSKGTLSSRIVQLIKFGKGENIGHRGGRYIWQLKNAGKLVVAWKCLSTDDPKREKTKLITEFRNIYGKRPFANLQE